MTLLITGKSFTLHIMAFLCSQCEFTLQELDKRIYIIYMFLNLNTIIFQTMIQYIAGYSTCMVGTYCITAAVDASQMHASHTQLVWNPCPYYWYYMCNTIFSCDLIIIFVTFGTTINVLAIPLYTGNAYTGSACVHIWVKYLIIYIYIYIYTVYIIMYPVLCVQVYVCIQYTDRHIYLFIMLYILYIYIQR